MTVIDDVADPPETGSLLLPVIRVIPEAAYDNPTWKGLAYFARDLAHLRRGAWPGWCSPNNPFLLVAAVGAGVAGRGRPVHHRPRRRPRGAVQVAPAQLDRRPPRHAARRGTCTRPGCSATTASTTVTPSARAWTSCGTPITPEQYSSMSTFGTPAPPGRVVVVGRRRLLPARDLAQQDDHVQPAGQVGQGRSAATSSSCVAGVGPRHGAVRLARLGDVRLGRRRGVDDRQGRRRARSSGSTS